MFRSLIYFSTLSLLSACGGESTSDTTGKPQVNGEISAVNMQSIARMGVSGFSAGMSSSELSTASVFQAENSTSSQCPDGGSLSTVFSENQADIRIDYYQCNNNDTTLNGGMLFELLSSDTENDSQIIAQFSFYNLSSTRGNNESVVDGNMTITMNVTEELVSTSIYSPKLTTIENGESVTLRELNMSIEGEFSTGLTNGGDEVAHSTISLYVTDADKNTYFVYSQGALALSDNGSLIGTIIIESENDVMTIKTNGDGTGTLSLDEGADGSIDHEEQFIEQ